MVETRSGHERTVRRGGMRETLKRVRRLAQTAHAVKRIIFTVVALKGDAFDRPVIHNVYLLPTSHPRYSQFWKNASFADNRYGAVHFGPGHPGYPVRGTFSKHICRISSVDPPRPSLKPQPTISTGGDHLLNTPCRPFIHGLPHPQHRLRSPRHYQFRQALPRRAD